jgi:hypothetical protein
MAFVWVRIHGGISSSYSKELDNARTIRVEFTDERLPVKYLFSKLDIAESIVAFIAINGVKTSRDAWIKNGDDVSIFSVVAGG